ncbi:DUF309 domain-containing protein [Bacillus sp. FJAT-45350]|uniref:DUF309 domain-containing protein n=1 Tax=Bacillus sp. FJAT-45350 TaxID=2011014 RepID=UPI000BB82A0F|nr:DUF309 domain-containing protein [Bacillus sp. FJAT-45350]
MYVKAYIDYLVYFNGYRDYFECHEVLEEQWKEDKEHKWVGLIQLAVGLYHFRRDNTVGALRMLKSSKKLILSYEKEISKLLIDTNQLIKELDEVIVRIETSKPYKDITIPLIDVNLFKKCEILCTENGYSWGNPSNLQEEYLIHKHTKRDRTDVISERNKQLEVKRQKKSKTLKKFDN